MDHHDDSSPSRIRRPRRQLGLTIVAAVLSVLLAATVAEPAGATASRARSSSSSPSADSPPAPPAPVSADDVLASLRIADVRVKQAKVRVSRAERFLRSAAAVQRRAEQVQLTAARREASTATAVENARKALDRVMEAVGSQRVRLRQMARETYVHSGNRPLEDLRLLLTGTADDPVAQSQMVSAEVVRHEAHDLLELRKQLPARRSAMADADAAERTQAAGLGRTTERMRAARAHTTARRKARDEANLAMHEAEAEQTTQLNRLSMAAALPGQEVPTTVTILGQQRLSPEDLAGWFITSGYTSKATVPITELAKYYIEEGAAEGVRGDIAFAQAVLETGGFRNRDTINLNNYAGVGHCDSCPRGWLFATARDGVRAQIQLLKSYALKNPTYRRPLVDRRLHGPAGCCQTWAELSSVWATGPGYGMKIMAIYARIVSFAIKRRTGILANAGLPVIVPPAPAVPPPLPPPIQPVTIPPKLTPPPKKPPPIVPAKPTTTTRPPSRPTTTTRPPTTTTTTRPPSTTSTTRPPTTTTTTTTTPSSTTDTSTTEPAALP